MQFIIGLGNPGSEYAKSRHNLGFMIADLLAERWGVHFTNQKKCQAEIAKHGDRLLVKPQTFMNDSGLAVQAILKYYGEKERASEYQNVWVVFDDLDLAVGTFKIQFGTGPKVHNGLSSIYDHLKTDQFWHVRIGADGRAGDRTIPPTQYVLSGFPPMEEPLISATLSTVIAEIEKRTNG